MRMEAGYSNDKGILAQLEQDCPLGPDKSPVR